MELSPMVSEFLFYEENADKEEKSNYIDLKIQIRELIKNDFNRKILTEVLLDLRKDVSGDTKQRLFKLYQDLGLDQDAYEKLKSWKWEVIAKGISHLTQMQVEPAYSFIIKFVNNRRHTVRKQAEIAAVTLKPEGINYFLDTTRYKISEWQQLKLLDVLRNRENFEPPRFKYWLTSTNKHVVLFAIRLIKHYNQNDANAALIELVKHRNNQIKTETIQCIQEFYVTDAIPMLKQVFPKCNVDLKVSILGAIGELGDETDIAFLEKVAASEGNFAVKSKAFGAINMISPDTIMPTEGLDNKGIQPVLSDLPIEKPKELETQETKELPQKHVEEQEDVLSQEAIEAIKNRMSAKKMEDISSEDHQKSSLPTENEPSMVLSNEINSPSKAVSEEEIAENNISQLEKLTEPTEAKNSDVIEEQTEIAKDKLEEKEETAVYGETTKEDVSINDEHKEQTCIESEKYSFTTASSISIELTEDYGNKPSSSIDLDFNFLPIVIEESNDKYHQNNSTMNESHQPEKDIRQIEVAYEVIKVEDIPNPIADDEFDLDISDFEFLPIVIDNEEESQVIENSEVDNLSEEIDDLNFLPLVTDGVFEPTTEEQEQELPMEEANEPNLTTLEGYKLSDFEIDFEQTDNTPIEAKEPVFELEEEPLASISIDADSSNADDVISWLMEQNELGQIEVDFEEINTPFIQDESYSNLIPEPIYYDEHETYMMGLLDDLQELGDYREIPLLEELLAGETKTFIKDRISQLITTFSQHITDDKKAKKEESAPLNLPNFSVFADLFKSIDTEAKLILLDEVVAVGDEKEIEFLDTLLEDPDPQIRKKAQTVLKTLVTKVSTKSDTKNFKKKVDDEVLTKELFDNQMARENPSVTYTTEEYQEVISEIEENEYFDDEFFSIDFEVSEVLDKTYPKKILDLPVEAVEITPNGASLMFQIYQFTKAFHR